MDSINCLFLMYAYLSQSTRTNHSDKTTSLYSADIIDAI